MPRRCRSRVPHLGPFVAVICAFAAAWVVYKFIRPTELTSEQATTRLKVPHIATSLNVNRRGQVLGQRLRLHIGQCLGFDLRLLRRPDLLQHGRWDLPSMPLAPFRQRSRASSVGEASPTIGDALTAGARFTTGQGRLVATPDLSNSCATRRLDNKRLDLTRPGHVGP